MTRRIRVALLITFAITGFSALTLQVVWQRVISLHSGVDLVSFTTVVAAFLAGLGLGSLLGGALADRLGARRSLLAFAVTNACIATYAWLSIVLFYDVYRDIASDLDTTLATFAFNFVLLVIPTALMGLSLPLVARGVVARVQEAAPLVGRLYSVNTLGAAAGAGIAGWFLMGTFGFTTTVRIAGSLNLLAALLVFSLWRVAANVTDRQEIAAGPATASPSATRAKAAPRAWPWFAIYALTGAVALGFELVFFRVIDSIMRSNSYSFPHVLALYLLLFGSGTAVGARVVERVARPARWFLGLQSSAGLAAILGLVVLTVAAPALGLDDTLRGYFEGPGFHDGFGHVDTLREWVELGFAFLGAPLLIMAVPVFLFGASFPFVQALVSERVETLGRRTGTLFAANIAGNVVGTLLVGFVLIDEIGTAATTLVLGGVLVVPGLAAALSSRDRRRRVAVAGGVLVAFSLAALLFPSNRDLWAFVHGTDGDAREFDFVEDRSCVTAVKGTLSQRDTLQATMFVNGSGQSDYPWNDLHVLIGLTPALVHQAPDRGMALGLGFGGTAYAMAQDPRLGSVDAVELCGGEIDLLRRLAAEGAPGLRRVLREDRLRLRVGDGRKFLLLANRDFDVVSVDVLRPQSAFSGNTFSVEFYELVDSRLSRDGVMAQWIPRPRVANGVAEVFPYALALSYLEFRFFVASKVPIVWDRDEILRRFDALPRKAFGPGQRQALRSFYATVEPVCLADGAVPPLRDDTVVNRDLAPRDEYFLNNPEVVPARARCS